MDDAHARWLVLLLLGILLLPIALYGWRSAPKAAMNRHFAMQTLVVAWWVIGIAGTHSSYAAEFWGRWVFAAAALMPAAFLSFAEVFPTPGQLFPTVFTRSIRVFAIVFATAAVTTPWIARDFVVTAGVLTRTPGPLMRAFSLYFLTSAAFIFVLLARKWRAARGLERAQLHLYFLGLSLFYVGAITTNLLLPSIVGDSRYSTLGPAFVPVFLAFVAHGIIRHRLMNVRLVVHNWLTACIASLVSIVPLSFVASRLEPLANPTSTTSGFPSMLPLLLAGLLAPPLWIKTRDLLHRYVYRGNADFRLRISEASDRLSQVLAQKETATVIIDTVFAAVRPEGVAVYVDDGKREGLNLLQSRQTHSSFATPFTLPEQVVSELKEWRLLASFQSVPAEASAPPSDVTAEILEKNHWALIIPFVTEAQLIGAVAVGGKLSGDPYFLEDVELLQVLGSQATVAFKNGQLYERVLLANQHIANIVATIQSGIIVVYDRQTVRIMNDAAVRLLGLPRTLSVPAVVSTEQLPTALVSILDETRESGSATQTVELIISAYEGTHPIACSTSLLRRPDGYIVGIVAALGDLSTLKALEVERGRAERLNYFETLAAALAHEIGNPIAPIKLMTQLLPARFHSEVFIHDFTRTVSREIARIEKLVERLRSLSRPAHRERVAVDLRTALRDAIDLVQPVLDERRINLVTSISARPLVICGDPSELQELFLNLLTNAVEATPDAGHIVVEAACESSDALVRFSDSGPGIASDIVDKIFQPFVSSKHRGSGLGLTICSGVIER